jgi:hypothetical protein
LIPLLTYNNQLAVNKHPEPISPYGLSRRRYTPSCNLPPDPSGTGLGLGGLRCRDFYGTFFCYFHAASYEDSYSMNIRLSRKTKQNFVSLKSGLLVDLAVLSAVLLLSPVCKYISIADIIIFCEVGEGL